MQGVQSIFKKGNVESQKNKLSNVVKAGRRTLHSLDISNYKDMSLGEFIKKINIMYAGINLHIPVL